GPGCDNCYAERFAERWRGIPGHPYEQGFDLTLWPSRLKWPAPIGWSGFILNACSAFEPSPVRMMEPIRASAQVRLLPPARAAFIQAMSAASRCYSRAATPR